MRKSNTQSIQDILRESLKELNIDKKIKEVKLVKNWDVIVGKTIAKYTTDIRIFNRVLFVKLSSSVVRNELFMIKEGLLKRLNEEAGETIIDDIVLK